MLATVLISQGAIAKTLEDVLKEKGVITEADYKEVTKVKPVQYKLGKGFTFTAPDEKFQLSVGGRLQPRYTFIDLEDNSKKTDSSAFAVKRARLWLRGYAYTKDLTYYLQTDFAQAGTSKLLLDSWLNYRFIDEVQIQAGQLKTPFGRQWLASSADLEFVDRSVVSDAFRPGYDTGVNLHGDIAKGIATYDIGAYGGAGWSTVRTSTDNAIAARVAVNPFGKLGYSEGDLDQSAKPLLSIGANYFGDSLRATRSSATATPPNTTTLETNNLNFASSGGWLGKGLANFTTSENIDINSYGIDAAFKWNGLFVSGEYLLGEAEGATSGKLLRAQGFYAQAGYFIIPKTLEAAFRYSYLDSDRDKSNDLQVDTQGAVSYYFDGHNLKLQSDITNSHIQHAAGPTDDLQLRLQATIVF